MAPPLLPMEGGEMLPDLTLATLGTGAFSLNISAWFCYHKKLPYDLCSLKQKFHLA